MKILVDNGTESYELEVARVTVIVPDVLFRDEELEEQTGTMYLKLSAEGLIVDVEDYFGASVGTNAYDNDWFLEAATDGDPADELAYLRSIVPDRWAANLIWTIEDWSLDVQNGDTTLGYPEWVAHNRENFGTP